MHSFQPPQAPYERKPSWWNRNWKWALPAGCIGMLLFVLVVVGFVAAIVMGVFAMIKSSGPYEQAIARANSSVEVRQALGAPIEEGWYVMGNVQINGPSGNANISIPLSGPNGEGTLYVEATKSADVWTFQLLQLEVKRTGQRIDLLNSGTM